MTDTGQRYPFPEGPLPPSPSVDPGRRRFLLQACTTLGCAGLAGLLLDSGPTPTLRGPATGGSHAGPARPAHPRPKAADYDRERSREALRRLESLGFAPREALFWEKTASGLIRCTLCPTFCELRPFERGRCRVRLSLENRLGTVVYGRPCSVGIDPIEKKPVFHLLPGSTSFSIATAGCLLSCRYCQNWQISQSNPEDTDAFQLPPEKVVESALLEGCRSIAYTYTEPTIFYEYMLDTARLARARGLYNVVVSCGYINSEPLRMLLPHIDVMKVDLKGFTERFYRTVCGGGLAPVLAAIQMIATSQALVDIVTLVVPTLNDDLSTLREMFRWIAREAGPKATLFLSRFHPTFQLRNLPPTPVEFMQRARDAALAEGVPFVYLGNVPGHAGENTFCPGCHRTLITRVGYQVLANDLRDGACPDCGRAIPGIWR